MTDTDSNKVGSLIHVHIAHADTACAQAFERYVGLSVPRWRVLHFLSEVDSATQKEICQRVEMDGWAVTRAVKPLEQAGLIHRTLDPSDNRLTRASITDKGKEWYKQAQDRRSAFLQQALHDFSDDELALFEQLLLRLTNNFDNPKLANYPPNVPNLSS